MSKSAITSEQLALCLDAKAAWDKGWRASDAQLHAILEVYEILFSNGVPQSGMRLRDIAEFIAIVAVTSNTST